MVATAVNGSVGDRISAATRPRGEGLRNRLKRFAGLVGIVRIVRALTTPLGRGRLRAGWRGADLFQPATVTRMDRHPALFELVATRLVDHAEPRLLSFGCSTGEEAFTLARHLPEAAIDAIDANPACIARARRNADLIHSKRIRFLCADSPDAVAPDLYDAVFCLSVLRHGDLESHRPERCTSLLAFARFAAAVKALDGRVRPGGLMVLWGCNFRFTDTATATGYRTIASPGATPQPGPFYGADDQLLPEDAYAAFVFVKLEGDRTTSTTAGGCSPGS